VYAWVFICVTVLRYVCMRVCVGKFVYAWVLICVTELLV
jgi:hypothetical protein